MSEAEFKDAYGNARRLNGASTDEQLSVSLHTLLLKAVMNVELIETNLHAAVRLGQDRRRPDARQAQTRRVRLRGTHTYPLSRSDGDRNDWLTSLDAVGSQEVGQVG